MWKVREAKARFEEILGRANAGEPQTIGVRDPCVVMSLADYERMMAVTGARDSVPRRAAGTGVQK